MPLWKITRCSKIYRPPGKKKTCSNFSKMYSLLAKKNSHFLEQLRWLLLKIYFCLQEKKKRNLHRGSFSFQHHSFHYFIAWKIYGMKSGHFNFEVLSFLLAAFVFWTLEEDILVRICFSFFLKYIVLVFLVNIVLYFNYYS